MENKLYPIGTVVQIKNAKVCYIIIGYCVKGEGKVYDYSGAMMPFGHEPGERIFMFNHDDIEKVVHEGYSSESYEFLMALKNELEDYKSKENN